MHFTTQGFPQTDAGEPAKPESPFALETILDRSTWSARRLSKKKTKLLARIERKVLGILEPGERVRYLTFGSGVSFWESYFLGWAMYYLNSRAILLTDRRMILVQIDWRRRPRELVSQIRYGAIRKVGRTLFGSTRMTLGDGKRHVLAYVPRRDRQFLRKLTDWIDRSLAKETTGWEDLCPHCYAKVTGRPAACPSCGGGIKSARKAGLLSLVFPGLGDLYLGHWKFALFEIPFTALIWLGVLMPDPAYPMTPLGLLFTAVFMVVVVHGADALGTWYLARKGLYPERG